MSPSEVSSEILGRETANQIDVLPRRRYPLLRILLKRVKHVDPVGKLHGVVCENLAQGYAASR